MSGTVTGAATGAAASAAASSRTRLAGNLDTFLTLLTTQLKNQSPDDPLDTNEMTAQLVQFANVEQQVNMNANLEKLLGLQQIAQLTAAAPLLGQEVEVAGDRLALQSGAARLRLPAAGAASMATVTVSDSSGRALRSAQVALGAAPQVWNWDGRDSDGRQLADGAYKVSVVGSGGTGAASTLDFTVLGTATGAERQGGNLQLMLGRAAYGFDDLRALRPRS